MVRQDFAPDLNPRERPEAQNQRRENGPVVLDRPSEEKYRGEISEGGINLNKVLMKHLQRAASQGTGEALHPPLQIRQATPVLRVSGRI